MRVLLTGATGFLGWHTRVRLQAITEHEVVVATRDSWSDLTQLVASADAVIHVAGVNRGEPEEVEHGNIALASSLADAIVASGSSPRVVYANSIHAGSDSAYGVGKAAAGDLLASACQRMSGSYVDVRLPNLFGEHGRPRYNSFVATFVESVIAGSAPEIQDRQVSLLHAQDAAQSLIDALTLSEAPVTPVGTETSVQSVYETLRTFLDLYGGGDIPSLTSTFEVNIFNTLRAALFPKFYPIPLTTHSDGRGQLIETVRAHGGQGQTFVSTTRPGMSRGDHFHLSKIERFVVLSGRGRISLRRLFHDEVVSYEVDGRSPVVVDMPTMWLHNITNIGGDELVTMFWTNTLFDPAHADTFWEPVGQDEALA